jgi:hypothetical protein
MSSVPILDVRLSAAADDTVMVTFTLVAGGQRRHLGSLRCTPIDWEQLHLTLLFGDRGVDRGGAPAVFEISERAQALLDTEAANRERDLFQDGASR